MSLRAAASLLAAIVSLVALPAALPAADRMAVGQWEFTLSTDGATRTSKHCVTQDEAASVNGSMSSAREHATKSAAQGHCSMKSFDMRGETVSYALNCGTRLIESTAAYRGNTFEGVLTTTTEGKATKTRITARRLGACP